MRIFVTNAVAIIISGGLLFSGVSMANADSCWNHNGSVMRLKAQGNQRWFYYEQPRQVLWNAGVRQGTLFFNGWKNGDWYNGTARRFSKFCPGTPLEYQVEGPVGQGPLSVTLNGEREVFKQCVGTGQWKADHLVFTYMHDC